ncbi:prophage antirepressor [Leptolyngbya sp. Heron Island J]|uniref:hypothetical protein n=1 Tax=Leptolyngbya sp. Heron Island J TaxID=1385935 RepID=UPI0003B9F013|nr:hypothetical protein [Leptolyngbya sp. Heron Island J]ESA35952.1 prophage antirepressor [Leptolyngbya sp. Heron Island J]
MTKPILTIVPELGAKIRRTEDGRCSVYDLIRAVGQKKNPYTAWDRLTATYPEVLAICEDWKFKGARQRKTPVVNLQGWLQILPLLPGAMGKKYREEAAQLVTRYIQGDVTLAAEVADRNDNPEDLKWLEKRVKSKNTRNNFTATLAQHGVVDRGYADCTNNVYVGLYGGTAKQLKQQRGLTKKDNLRDKMTTSEISQIDFAEDLASRRLKKLDAHGNQQCAEETLSVAKKVAELTAELLGE